MGQVTVTIGGRSYRLACRDGEEAHLASLAEHVGRRADEVTSSLGQVSEARLLLMAAVLVTDELFEARGAGAARGGDEPGAGAAGAEPDPAEGATLERLAERLESVIRSLEQSGGDT